MFLFMFSQLISSFNEQQNDPVGLRVQHRSIIHMRLRDGSRFLSCLFQPMFFIYLLLRLLYKVRRGSNELMNVELSPSSAIGSTRYILAVRIYLASQKKRKDTLT